MVADDLIEFLEELRASSLIEQFGVTDDVDEKDMPDLELDFLSNLRGHTH